MGHMATRFNTTGNYNAAFGYWALRNNTSGYGNVGVGDNSLFECTNGFWNTGIGSYALGTITTGDKNIGIGRNAQAPSATTDYSCTLGDSSINNLRCNDTSISGLSDERDKAEITDLPNEAGLDLINALRPVTFYWDRREWYDDDTPDGSKIKRDYRSWKTNSGQRQGFIAQEVESAISGHKYLEDSQVVNGTAEKKEFAPQHLLTNAIKAIQQLSAKVEELESEIATLKGA